MIPIRLLSSARAVALATLVLAGLLSQKTAIGQAPAPDPAQVAETKARYTKYEYKIPMRDGVKLFTAVYVPKDQSQKYPMLMTRTPYSVRPYGEEQYRARLGQSSHYDESSDTYDTIDWLIKHVPNNNGNVGLMGISYPGFYSSCGLVDAHPALKAVSPQAPVTDWFVGDDYHHNGAFILADSINFLEFFDRPQRGAAANRGGGRMGGMRREGSRPDVYNHYLTLGRLDTIAERQARGGTGFLKDLVEHPNYDEWWKARTILPHLKHVKPAVLTVGGWYDCEDLWGAIQVYESIERQSPETVNRL